MKNVRVYGLAESIVASGYPMRSEPLSESEFEKNTNDMRYWFNNYRDFLFKFMQYQKDYAKDHLGLDTKESCYYCGSNTNVQKNNSYGHYVCSKCNHQIERYGEPFKTTPKYTLLEDGVQITYFGDCRQEHTTLISYSSLPVVFGKKLSCSGGYHTIRIDDNTSIGLHRFVMGEVPSDLVVDHVKGDINDNRLSKLRVCTRKENSRNTTCSNSIIGVSYRKDRNKWRAYINNDYKQIYLGEYKTKDEAVKARLIAEKTMFKDFAPQKYLYSLYGLEIEEEARVEEIKHDLQAVMKHVKRGCLLGNTKMGCAEDNYLNGVIVQFDLTLSNKAWVEAERYHFLDFVSSMSTMHRIAKMDINDCCNEYVDERIKTVVNNLVEQYNADPTPEKYLTLLYNIPSGFEITARMTTNYRQLKTIWNQRHNHRLPEWREFCKEIEELPMFVELTGCGKTE